MTEQNQALEVIPEGAANLGLANPAAPATAITPAQAKVDAIANLTMSAYQKAATLEISAEESAKLKADFPDEAFQTGAAGKENLLYIEHAHLRDRFNEVFGMGKWAIIPRNRWSEPFTTQRGTPGERIYVEAMLVVRGCFVGEAVGAMEYYPKNESQNYSDACEGAKTAAFRRCAKEFGVGLQAWKKEWCEQWWARKRSGSRPKAPVMPSPTTQPKTQPSPALGLATEAHKKRLIELLTPLGGAALEYCQKSGMLLPTETLDDLPLRFVPATKEQKDDFMVCVQSFVDGGEAKKPACVAESDEIPFDFPPESEPQKALDRLEKKAKEASNEPWRSFPMPFGKQAGVKLEDLAKNYLFGLWANYKVETEYNGKPKKPETIKKDTVFRQMLDDAGKHYEFTKPEDGEVTP